MLKGVRTKTIVTAAAFTICGVGLSAFSSKAKATLIFDGTLSPVPSGTLPSGTITASESMNFSASVIGEGVVFTGTLYSEALNVGTALAPQYDFIYQLTNNPGSADPIARLSLSSFLGFTTDVSYSTTNAFVPGNTQPSDATSDPTGTVIGFDFDPNDPPGDSLGAGDTTYTLIVATDSTSFVNGNGAVTDDGAANALAVVPAYGFTSPPVPEPGSIALLLATGGLIMSRRRRVG